MSSTTMWEMKQSFKEHKKLAVKATKAVVTALIIEASSNAVTSFKSEAKSAFRHHVLRQRSTGQGWHEAPGRGFQVISTRRPEYWAERKVASANG